MKSRTGKRFTILIIIVAAVVGSFFVFKYVQNIRGAALVAQEKEEGLKYFTMGDYANALKHLKYYVAAEKKAVDAGVSDERRRAYADTLMIFAECRLNVPTPNGKHIIEGTALLKRAAFLKPDDPQPLVRLIGLYEQLGYLTERLDACEKLLKLDPENLFALKAQVETLFMLGRPKDTTESVVDTWIAAEPTNEEPREWKLTLMDHETQEEKNEQIRYVDDLVKKYPDKVGLALLRVKVLAQYGMREKPGINSGENTGGDNSTPTAESEIRKILKRPITDPKNIKEVVTLLDRLGMSKEADDFLTNRLLASKTEDEETGHKSGEVDRIIIERAWKQGKVEMAKQFALSPQDNLDQADEDLLGWSAFFTQSIESRAVDSVFYDELARRHSDKSRLWMHIIAGRDAMFRLNWVEARNELRQASRIGGGSPVAWLMLGQVDQTLGEFGLAISWLRKAADTDPTWANAHTLLAFALTDTGQLTQAKKAGEMALQAEPTAGQYVLLAQVYIKMLEVGQGDAQLKNETLNYLQSILKGNPDNPDIIAIYARALLVAGNSDKAMPYIHRLLNEKLIPKSNLLLNLVDTCNLFGIKGVDDLLTLGGSTDSSNIRVLMRLAMHWAELGQLDRGKVLLEDAVKSASGASQLMERKAALATFLDQYRVSGTKNMLSQLSDEYPKSAFIQRIVLDSRSIWSDDTIVSKAVNRLHELTGDDAVGWRNYEARRLLTFDASQASASKVVEMLDRVVKSNPADIRAQALLAEAYETLNDNNAAILTLSKAVDSNLVQVELYPRLIDLLNKAGQSEEAETRLREFARRSIPPDRVDLLRSRVILLINYKMLDEALRLQKPMTAAGHAADWSMLGYLQERMGDRDAAIKSYNAALAAPDVNDSTIQNTADFLARSGNYQRGLDLLNNLSDKISPVNQQLVVAQYMEQSGRLNEAEGVLRKLTADNNDPNAWDGLIRFLLRQKRYDEAELTLKDAKAVAPGNTNLRALGSLITALQGGEINEDTLTALGLDKADPETREASKLLIDAEIFKRKHQKDFDTYLQQIINSTEQEIDNNVVKAVHEYIDQLKEVTNRHPSVYAGWYLLTMEYLRDRMINKAVQSAQTAARVLPGSRDAAKLATQTLVTAGKYDSALAYAKNWRSMSLDDPFDADMSIGFIEWRLNNFDDALKQILPWEDRIVQSAEEIPDNLVLYATLLVHQGKLDEAREIVWPFVEKGEPWISSYARMAEPIASPQEAEKWVNRVESLSKSNIAARSIVVGEYYKIAQKTAKKADFQKVIDLASSDVDNEEFNTSVISMVADAQQTLGNKDEAERLYRLVLNREPTNAMVMNNLAYLLYEINKTDSDAESLARQAVDLAKQYRFNNAVRANLIETLGLILIKNKKYDDAVSFLTEGKSLDIDSLPVRIALIEAYLGKGDNVKASNELNDFDRTLRQTNRPLSREQSQRLDVIRNTLKNG